MKPIKFFLLPFIFTAFCNICDAQLFAKPNKPLNDALQKVINDIPNHLQNLQGVFVQKDAQSITYESKIKIPGAIHTTLTAYTSKKDKSKSMEASIFETEDFAEAKKKYNELVNQLKMGSFNLPGEINAFKWKVNYDKPDESKNFFATIFRTGSEKEEYKNLKLEVSLNAMITSYTVSLFVYEKKEDDELTAGNANDY